MSREAQGHRRPAQEGADPKILPSEAQATTAAQNTQHLLQNNGEKSKIMEAKEWFSVGAYLQVEGFIPSAWWSVSLSYSGLFFKSSHKVVQDFFVVASVPLWLHIEAAVADIFWWQAEHKYYIFFIPLHNIFCSRCQANCMEFAASSTALVLKFPCRKLHQHSM